MTRIMSIADIEGEFGEFGDITEILTFLQSVSYWKSFLYKKTAGIILLLTLMNSDQESRAE